MDCVSSSSFSILVNDSPQQVFRPSRGLRQGYPLSPYLFILCAEVLSSQLHAAEQQGLLTGVPIVKDVLSINHLFFANDSLLFCRANMVECGRLNHILCLYEQSSGQVLNVNKTSLFFSRDTMPSTKAYIKEVAGLSDSSNVEKYLGLPSLVGMS